MNATFDQIRKGDEFSFVAGDEDRDYGHYEALSGPSDDGTVRVQFHGSDNTILDPENYRTDTEFPVHIFNRDPAYVRVSTIKPGERFSFLNPEQDADNYYVAPAEWGPDKYEAEHHYYGEVLSPLTTIYGADTQFARIIDTTNAQEGSNNMDTSNNSAKLELAADLGLQAKFNYTNLAGETHDVRLKVEDIFDGRVGGVSYDSLGHVEGYKQYRLDRINDGVVIR